MVDKANLPRQDSVISETGKPSREWYNFFRRLLTQVNELQDNPPSSGSDTPPFLNTGCCEEITVQDATTARTLTADDDKVNVEFTSASAITVTVNADVMPENSITYLTQGAAGQVTVVAGAGVTIDYSDTLKTRTQESMIGLKQIQLNKFELFGDAEPLALARSALIRAANSTGAPAWVAPTADSQKLKRVSGALAWATDTASEIVNVPAGNISSTNVQSAIDELDTALSSVTVDFEDIATDVKLTTVGNGLYLSEGTNATMGVATLVAGTKVVSTTKVTANSRIFTSIQSLGTVTVPKGIGVTARTAATSFTITSADATDTSVIAWNIIEPIISTAVTWNPADIDASLTLSGGDLIADFSSASWRCGRATIGRSTGKYYFEVKTTVVGATTSRCAGVAQSGHTLTNYIGSASTGWGHLSDGYKTNAGFTAYGSSWETVNDVLMVAVDFATGKIWFGKNGTWMASGDPAAGTSEAYATVSGTVYPACGAKNANAQLTGMFKAADLAYSPPSGFSAWE